MEERESRLLVTEESDENPTRRLKCRYFLVSAGRPVREWFPPKWDDSLPVDCLYFGQALAELDRMLPEEYLQTQMHIYLTYNSHTLPEYGPHVVVLLLGEEFGLIPRYGRHVRAVFKTHRIRPVLGSSTWWRLDHLHLVLWLKFIRNLILHLRSSWEYCFVPREWPQRVHSRMYVLDVPEGYGRQEQLPQKRMQDRPFHCFFAGGVNLKMPFWRRLIPSPKVISRRKMLAVVRQMIEKDPRFCFDGGEANYSPLHRTAEYGSYSQRLMDSKICLAPRGTVLDSLRFFEGLRAGCLVVCEHLTNEWFYAGAPVLQIKDWSNLPEVIEPYLYDNVALEEARIRSLAWWRDKCGEKAVGQVMAEYLVEAGDECMKMHLQNATSTSRGECSV